MVFDLLRSLAMKENKGIVTKCRGSNSEESSRHFRPRFLSWSRTSMGFRSSLCSRGARMSWRGTRTGRGRVRVETVFGEEMLRGEQSPGATSVWEHL